MNEQAMSREEAERLAHEFLKRPVNRFYDENYTPDTTRRIVQDVIDFASILGKRGYGLICKDGFYTVTHGTTQSLVAEEFFKYQTIAEVTRQLDVIVGQHHVCCAQCHEPLLHTVNQQKALDTYQRRSMPDMVLETTPERVNDVLLQWTERKTVPVDVIMKTGGAGLDAIKQATEYRSAKAGPSSPVLTNCPGCGVVLSNETVQEIQDAN